MDMCTAYMWPLSILAIQIELLLWEVAISESNTWLMRGFGVAYLLFYTCGLAKYHCIIIFITKEYTNAIDLFSGSITRIPFTVSRLSVTTKMTNVPSVTLLERKKDTNYSPSKHRKRYEARSTYTRPTCISGESMSLSRLRILFLHFVVVHFCPTFPANFHLN